MTATGFAFFISPLLRQLDGAVAYTVWSLLVDTWIFFYVPLLLTLLTRGRMRAHGDRLLVAAYALPLALLQVIWLLFAEERGREPAARVPGRGRRARDRPHPARLLLVGAGARRSP